MSRFLRFLRYQSVLTYHQFALHTWSSSLPSISLRILVCMFAFPSFFSTHSSQSVSPLSPRCGDRVLAPHSLQIAYILTSMPISQTILSGLSMARSFPTANNKPFLRPQMRTRNRSSIRKVNNQQHVVHTTQQIHDAVFCCNLDQSP